MTDKKTNVGRAALFADIKAGSPTDDLAYVVLYLDDNEPWEFIACKTQFDLSYEICKAIRDGFDFDIYLADEYDEDTLYESLMGPKEDDMPEERVSGSVDG